jgi:hypothetical protein
MGDAEVPLAGTFADLDVQTTGLAQRTHREVTRVVELGAETARADRLDQTVDLPEDPAA